MQEFLKENIHRLDLSNIEYIPEIIYKLSSVLEQDEVKNKQICLVLGNVDLNQAQLLSIKSLISGFGSSLAFLETKSKETEITALSIGIEITNTEMEFSSEIENHNLIEQTNEQNISQDTNQLQNNDVEKETTENTTPEIIENTTSEEIIDCSPKQNYEEIDHNIENKTTQNAQCEIELENNPEDNKTQEQEASQNLENAEKEASKDELDIIFNSESMINNVFEAPHKKEKYAEREELTDIIVPIDEYTKEDIEIETFSTKYIKQTIRSGQVINYEGNVIIIGDCHPGSEINAYGDITIWGVLSGIAHAGAGGNKKARVRALKMNAIQLRIADCYSRRPDSLNKIFVEKTNSFTPEEARIINGEIVVFKIND